MRRSIHLQAPAKLNLALSVGPPAPHASGMHPICSWMVTVDLYDELNLTRLEQGNMSRYAIYWHKDAKRRCDINWSITKDLAVRAHLALERHVGRSLPVQMKLEKRIPVGGGLGGGSSDAAAMLRGTNELFELGLTHDELAAIGATLGSDVPFLVQGGSAIVQGFGERITYHDRPPSLHAVIAFPDAVCPTARVYGLFDRSIAAGSGASLKIDEVIAIASSGMPLQPQQPFNALAAAAMMVAEQLEDDLKSLSDLAQRPAHVSGSGSSIFVVCDDAVHAAALAEAVERKLSLPAVSVKTV